MFRFLRVVPTRLFTPVAGLRGSGAAVTAAVAASLPLASPSTSPGFHRAASTAAVAASKRQSKQQPTPNNKKNGARVKPAAMWTDAAIGTIAGYDQYGPNAHDAPHIRHHTTNAYLAARRAEGKKFAEAQLRYRSTPTTKRSVEPGRSSSSVRSSGRKTEDPYAGELTHYLQDEPETYRTTTSWGARGVTRGEATTKKKLTTKTAAARRHSRAFIQKKGGKKAAAKKAASAPATRTAAVTAGDVPEYYRPRLHHAHPYRHRFQSSQALGEDCEASREGEGPDPVPDGKKPRVGEVVMGRRLWQLQPRLKKGSLGSTAGLD